MRKNRKQAGRKHSRATGNQRRRHVVVIELDHKMKVREPGKPHLYVTSTMRRPQDLLDRLQRGKRPSWMKGELVRLRQDLIFDYRPTTSKKVIDRRLEETKLRVARMGYAVNGDANVWSVYVLDVDPDAGQPLLERGRLNRVIYVGQTSKDVDTRLKEHRGESVGRKGQYLGAPSVKGRRPRLNRELAPKRQVFTKEDAIKLESKHALKLAKKGYRVLGDGVQKKKSKSQK
jgi:hypothetical protein